MKRAVAPRQGAPEECPAKVRSQGARLRYGCRSSLRRSQVTVSRPVIATSSVGRPGAGRREVNDVGRLPIGSGRPLGQSADGVATRRLAVAVCATDEPSRGKSSTN
jgi:hypothetical protein